MIANEAKSFFHNRSSLIVLMMVSFWFSLLWYLSDFRVEILRFGMLFLFTFSAYCYAADFLSKRNVFYVVPVGLGCSILGLSFLMHGFFVTAAAFFLIVCFLFYYYGLRLFFSDPVISLFVTIFLTLLSSFFFPVQIATYILGIFFIPYFYVRKNNLRNYLLADFEIIKKLDNIDLFFWGIFFGTVVCSFTQSSSGVLALDPLHPLYEVSTGRSFGQGWFWPADLSYAGKSLRFHFLSTRLPIYFSEIGGFSLLESCYFVVPLLFSVVFFLVINLFFEKFPNMYTPFWLILLLPGHSWLQYVDAFFRKFFLSNSFFLGYIILLMSLYFIATKRYFWFFLAASILILVKASFFLSLLGGVGIFFLVTKKYKEIVSLVFPLGALFLICVKLFLSGAHRHNIWLFFPTIFYRWRGNFVNGFWMVWFFIAVLSVLFVFLSDLRRNRTLLLFASTALSGFLGVLFIVEGMEVNSSQFYVGVYFCVSVVFWHVFMALIERFPLEVRRLMVGGLMLFTFFTAVTIGRRHFELPKSALLHRSDEVCFKNDFINAYTWLDKNVTTDLVLLFGKHYEIRKKIKNVFSCKDGVARSALSGKQMYCENCTCKGIIMESDYSIRLAQIIHFYKNFVEVSEDSKGNLTVFYEEQFGKEKALPLSQNSNLYKGFSGKALHKLSFGREWFGRNMIERVAYECREYLQQFSKKKQWARTFLKDANIGYIVLEQGDMPGSFLQNITEQIYQEGDIMILKVKGEKL